MFSNLRIRLTVLFVTLTIIPLLIVAVIISSQASGTLQDQTIDSQEQLARQVAISFDSFFRERENELWVLTDVYGLAYLDEYSQRDVLLTLLSNQPAYYELIMVEPDGQESLQIIRGEAVTDDLANRADDELFQSALATGMISFSPMYFNEDARERMITMAVPVEDIFTGETGYVLIAEIRFQTIGETLLRNLELTDDEDVYVLDGTGLVVAHRNPNLVIGVDTVFNLPESAGRHTGLSGGDVILAKSSIQLSARELIVVAEKSYAAATALASRLIQLAAIITGVSLVLAGAIIIWVVHREINPIIRMSQVAESILDGDLSAQADETGTNEISKLGRTFNQMTAQLQTSIREEQAKQAYLEGMVNEYMVFIEDVAQGNLTRRLDLDAIGLDIDQTKDDLYLLGANLNVMVGNLSEMAHQVRSAANAVSLAVTEIQASSTQQTASALEQDATVSQTMATLEDVQDAVLQTADRAQNVSEAAQQSLSISLSGQEAVADSVNGMNLVRERVESIATNILMLSERTQQIGEIIETVNALSEQSKLLALNAGIEAARAGEEGRGFAVVAMEVRQLAEQSREATARVHSILEEIQQATNTAVMVTEEGIKGAQAGMTLADHAGQTIRELASTIENAAQAAEQIATSTRQQSNSMDQLSIAMKQIKQATTQATASTRQTEESVDDMKNMAQELGAAADRYEL